METNNSPKKSPSASNDQALNQVPPHDIELEQAVLGALMLEGDLYSDIAGILTADSFYDPRHAALFDVIRSLAAANRPVDVYTITMALKERKNKIADSIAYVVSLTQKVASGAHLVYHAQILRQLYIMRSMISEVKGLLSKCYDSDFDGMMDDYSATMMRMDSLFVGSGAEKSISEILKRHGQVIDERIQKANVGGLQGATYGLSELDRMTCGMCPGQLIIVAARPAMGKTAIALKFSKSAAMYGASVTIASLEMSDISLTDRLVSTYAGVDSAKIKSGRMNANDLRAYQAAVAELEKLPISIYDTPATTFNRLASMARTRHRKGLLDLLVIDYLQLIETDTDGKNYRNNREREVAMISRGLKSLALELKIPVVLLCQLNRAAESRQDKQPQLYDLRESGGIEQDADVVLMPFRPAYYRDTEFIDEDTGLPYPQDMGLLFIRKNRDGATGHVQFRYSPDLSEISDYEVNNIESSDKQGLFQ